MKLTFKEIDNGLSNEIYIDDNYIGIVTKDIWSGKWSINPAFNHYDAKKIFKKIKYDSFYKAGKALAKLYEDSFVFFDERDTHEFDMRDIFKQRGP